MIETFESRSCKSTAPWWWNFTLSWRSLSKNSQRYVVVPSRDFRLMGMPSGPILGPLTPLAPGVEGDMGPPITFRFFLSLGLEGPPAPERNKKLYHSLSLYISNYPRQKYCYLQRDVTEKEIVFIPGCWNGLGCWPGCGGACLLQYEDMSGAPSVPGVLCPGWPGWGL